MRWSALQEEKEAKQMFARKYLIMPILQGVKASIPTCNLNDLNDPFPPLFTLFCLSPPHPLSSRLSSPHHGPGKAV